MASFHPCSLTRPKVYSGVSSELGCRAPCFERRAEGLLSRTWTTRTVGREQGQGNVQEGGVRVPEMIVEVSKFRFFSTEASTSQPGLLSCRTHISHVRSFPPQEHAKRNRRSSERVEIVLRLSLGTSFLVFLLAVKSNGKGPCSHPLGLQERLLTMQGAAPLHRTAKAKALRLEEMRLLQRTIWERVMRRPCGPKSKMSHES